MAGYEELEVGDRDGRDVWKGEYECGRMWRWEMRAGRDWERWMSGRVGGDGGD